MLKKKILFILIIIMIVGIQTQVSAVDLLPSMDQQELQGNSIKIYLQLSDLQDYEDGINALSGKLVYNSEIFENASVTGMNSWSAIYNNEEENENQGKFILITTAGNVTQEQEIAQIELKLKKNVEQEETEIKIEQIETSYHAETMAIEDKVIHLEIEENEIKMIQNDNLNTEENKTQNQGTEKNIVQNQDEEEHNQENMILYFLIIILSIFIIAILVILIEMKGVKKNEK